MVSTYIQDHNRLFGDLSAELSRDHAKLVSAANGGRSILFVYPPKDEEKYIEEAKRRYSEGFEFVDLRQLFTQFVENKGIDKFKRQYKNMGTEVFVSQNYTEGTFFHFMMARIVEVYNKGVSPILIHTGVIYKMGFTNHNIMDNETLLKFKKPLVIFYPATLKNGKLYFLNIQNAINYRCVVVI